MGSLSYHILTCYYTECPPKIRLYSLLILHRKPCNHFQRTGKWQHPIQQHLTSPHQSAHSSSTSQLTSFFYHYQTQKATFHAIQFEPTRKIKQPIHCQVSSHTVPVGFSCFSAFSFQKVSSSLLSSVRTLRVQRTQQHFQIILFNKKC